MLEIHFVDLHLGHFPGGGFLAKAALWGSFGTAEHLRFSHFHCIAGDIFQPLCNLFILSEKKAFGSGQRKPQLSSSRQDCPDRP